MTKYRFENGKLFKYVPEQNAYVFCFSSPYATTRARAISMWLESGADLVVKDEDLIDEMHF